MWHFSPKGKRLEREDGQLYPPVSPLKTRRVLPPFPLYAFMARYLLVPCTLLQTKGNRRTAFLQAQLLTYTDTFHTE